MLAQQGFTETGQQCYTAAITLRVPVPSLYSPPRSVCRTEDYDGFLSPETTVAEDERTKKPGMD